MFIADNTLSCDGQRRLHDHRHLQAKASAWAQPRLPCDDNDACTLDGRRDTDGCRHRRRWNLDCGVRKRVHHGQPLPARSSG